MIDPRLNDRGFTEQYRAQLAYRAALIPADHPQLWSDSDLHNAAVARQNAYWAAKVAHIAAAREALESSS